MTVKNINCCVFDCVTKLKLNGRTTVEEKQEPMLKYTTMYIKELKVLNEVELEIVKAFLNGCVII